MAHFSDYLLLAILLASPYNGFSAANPTTTTSGSSSSTNDVTIWQFVGGHNAARQAVGVAPLKWNPKLAKYALAYARQRRRDCNLVHSPGYAYGENIFWGQGRQWTATAIMASWLAEKQWYHYDTNRCSGPDCSHYTQIVWRTTTSVGCAIITCASGDTFSVCEYYPPGNYIGARPYN